MKVPFSTSLNAVTVLRIKTLAVCKNIAVNELLEKIIYQYMQENKYLEKIDEMNNIRKEFN